ncbi:MAG: 1-acyl-sn-glycerol-3-phosphate acyltransferase PlsC [Thermacetogenium phaeum]|uniref:1-acyl-sn-glycerol-3-phosphate acyltransferase n=1 Tax=Thermacetogenium phaeum TaxID=85874 RepID=A0A124FKB8_9THEO|nr:MAG: 1-acyl-sn-glycerol-3-phosphate acyltransferase PlsC [Thermacetogenium phaeum]
MFYRLCRGLFRILFTCLCRWEIEGLQNVPEKGPVLIIANHISNWDPIVVGSALKRQVHFMAKKELFKIPVLSLIIKALGAFPVDRQRVDRAAIRRALELLENGKVVCIFPEGTRSKSGELLAPNSGAAYLALKSGAPVCPVALLGTDRIFSRGCFRKFRVRIGPLLDLRGQNRRDYQQVAFLMMEKIRELFSSSAQISRNLFSPAENTIKEKKGIG